MSWKEAIVACVEYCLGMSAGTHRNHEYPRLVGVPPEIVTEQFRIKTTGVTGMSQLGLCRTPVSLTVTPTKVHTHNLLNISREL